MLFPNEEDRCDVFVVQYNSGNQTRTARQASMAMIFYRDMELICRSCGATFIFTAGEQEFYADKGFLNEPTRCPKCRNRREAQAPRRRAEPRPEDDDDV